MIYFLSFRGSKISDEDFLSVSPSSTLRIINLTESTISKKAIESFNIRYPDIVIRIESSGGSKPKDPLAPINIFPNPKSHVGEFVEDSK